MYEENSDVVFFDAQHVTANLDLLKLASDTYEISSMTIYRPTGRIIRNEDGLNLSDLIEHFTRDSLDLEPRKTVRFNLLDFKIKKGKFQYKEDQIPINFFAKDIDISSTGLRWDNDTVIMDFSFLSAGKSGAVVGTTKINYNNLNYLFDLKIDNYDLGIVNQYLHDLTNEDEFSAQVNADINTTGNFQNADSVKASGRLAFQNFHIGKNKTEDFASCTKFSVSAKLLNPLEYIYDFDSIIVEKPFLKYEMYDALDNIQMMFGEGGSNVVAADANPKRVNLIIEIVRLVERLARNVLRSDYTLDRLAVREGNFEFVDYSIDGMFKAAAIPFNLFADSIYNTSKRVHLEINSGLKPNGRMHMNVSLDPNDSSYFDKRYRFENIPITMFNPYVVYYTRYQFDSGEINATGNWQVHEGNIDSKNHLVLVNPGVTKQNKDKQKKWIPMPFLLTLVKQKGNVIDYGIPIQGSLNDPNFKIWSIVSDALKNVLMKPVRVIPVMKTKKMFRRN